jgi:protein-L-isoaspartate(D-aspartate) O-methyltransferase
LVAAVPIFPSLRSPASTRLALVAVVVSAAALATVFVSVQPHEEDFRRQREEMVRTQLAFPREGVLEPVRNPEVLQAFRQVPRHRFVPAEWARYAYGDYPLPIGYEQTISQPYMVAKMTELVQPQKHHRVLEIGTGSGYQAAILAQLVAQVYTIEIVEPLALAARSRLAELGYKNVAVRVGDGYLGWPEYGPFDSIVVTAGAKNIPPTLVEQLKPGGRMVIPVGPTGEAQKLLLVTKGSNDPRNIHIQEMMDVRFVPLVRGRQ